MLLLLVTLVLFACRVEFENHLLFVRLRLGLHDFKHAVLVVIGGLIHVLLSRLIHSVVEVFIWEI